MLTVLYLTAAVNVMFHLMVSASIKEGIFESLLKIGLLVLTGWNMLSPLSMLVKLTIDSWEDLDYLTLNIIDAFARINYVATNGSFIRDLPEEIVRMHGYEIFDDIVRQIEHFLTKTILYLTSFFFNFLFSIFYFVFLFCVFCTLFLLGY
tara:strand:- start:430 stop:879 length:450 start_codon:yes stop_codon:yes gene_type:complete